MKKKISNNTKFLVYHDGEITECRKVIYAVKNCMKYNEDTFEILNNLGREQVEEFLDWLREDVWEKEDNIDTRDKAFSICFMSASIYDENIKRRFIDGDYNIKGISSLDAVLQYCDEVDDDNE